MVQKIAHHTELDTLRGSSALVIQAVKGITDLTEQLHGAIASLTFPLNGKNAKSKQTRGITHFVYRSVRGITQAVGWSIDQSLMLAQLPAVSKVLKPAADKLSEYLSLKAAAPYRENVRAAANGVLGDTLAATHNPLAIPMQFRQLGKPLATLPKASKILILIHGLCMNDLQWQRDSHDHGVMLAKEYSFEAVYLHYNTGRAIAENGAEFSNLLEDTLKDWPVPIEQLVIVGHSMGGLLARSACHHALLFQKTWVKHLSKLITLGSPHAGAPLERAGRGVDYILGISPYTAPFARIGLVRSAGIQGLRDGAVTPSGELALFPKHVKLYTLACTKQKAPSPEKTTKKKMAEPFQRLLGDGLVPVKSALAGDDKPSLGLPLKIPASRQAVVFETDHFQMLSSQEVAKQLLRWLKA